MFKNGKIFFFLWFLYVLLFWVKFKESNCANSGPHIGNQSDISDILRTTGKVLKAHAQHRPTSGEGFSMACGRITGPIRAFRSPYHLSVQTRPCFQQHPGTQTQNRQMTHKTIHTYGIYTVLFKYKFKVQWGPKL